MNRHDPLSLVFLVIVALVLLVQPLGAGAGKVTEAMLQADPPAAKSPSSGGGMFIENVGQYDKGARFLLWGGGPGNVWLADDAVWVTLIEQCPASASDRDQRLEAHADETRDVVNLRLSFDGANPDAALEPYGRLETKVSYFLGSDPDAWRADVPVWRGVRWRDLYPGLDLTMTTENGRYAWRVEANESIGDAQLTSALSQVRLVVEGSEGLLVEEGRLLIETAIGDLAWPLLEADGDTPISSVAANVVNNPFGAAGVEVPCDTVLLDRPGDLVYATYLGGSGDDYAEKVAADAEGCAYVTGGAWSTDFPAGPGYDVVPNGLCDAFVCKVSDDGMDLDYATFLGGGWNDFGFDIAVDAEGCAYVVGSTASSGFPASYGPGYDTSFGSFLPNPEGFCVKLSPMGTAIMYATFLGGAGWDRAYAVALDQHRAAYVAGWTDSADFPAVREQGYDHALGASQDAFVVKLSPSGLEADYATYLGGASASVTEVANAIAVDASGCAYVVGETADPGFPSGGLSVYQSTPGGAEDAYVTKVSADGKSLVWSTFLGGAQFDAANGVAVDALGCAYVAGATASSDLIAEGVPGYDTSFATNEQGYVDAFVCKLASDGHALDYCTYLGAASLDVAHAIALDGSGCAFVTGVCGWGFPISDGMGYDTIFDGGSENISDFVLGLSPSGTELVYGSFLGLADATRYNGVAIGPDGTAHLVGESEGWPHPAQQGPGYDTTYNGGEDGYLVKLETGGVALPTDPYGETPPKSVPAQLPRPANDWVFERESWKSDECWFSEVPSLVDMQIQYAVSDISCLMLTVPIWRYYGTTDDEGVLSSTLTDRGTVNPTCTLTLKVYDWDKGEELWVTVNDGVSRHCERSTKDDTHSQWVTATVELPTAEMRFPQNPGKDRSGVERPRCQNDGSDQPTGPMPMTNTISVDVRGRVHGKIAVAEAELWVRGVRPIILVPGYSGESCEYKWDRDVDGQRDPQFLYQTLSDAYGLQLVRQCQEGAHSLFERHWVCYELVGKNPLLQDKGTLSRNVTPLEVAAADACARYHVDRVNFVGHSKGGLFTRSFVDGSRDGWAYADNVIALDSVQLGAYTMDLRMAYGQIPPELFLQLPGWLGIPLGLVQVVNQFVLPFPPWATASEELTIDYVTGFNAQHMDQSQHGVRYHSVLGYAGQVPGSVSMDVNQMDPDRWRLTASIGEWALCPGTKGVYWLNTKVGPLRGPSDTLLTCPSQRIGNIDNRVEVSCRIVAANHEEGKKFPASATAVALALGLNVEAEDAAMCWECADYPEIADLPADDGALASDLFSDADPYHSIMTSGVLTYGQAIDLPVPIDGDHIEAYVVWQGEDGLDLTLTAPDAQSITPAVAKTDPNIAYDELRDAGSVGYVGYVITDTLAGGWTLHLAAPASGDGPDITYDLSVVQRSPVVCDLSTSQEQHQHGETVRLTAEMRDDGAPVLGASLVSTDEAADGTTLQLTLLDDGAHGDGAANDGVYGCEYAADIAGRHRIAVTATGTLPSGLAFQRQQYASTTVLPSGARLSGLYVDDVVDDDGDGLYDELVITTAIEIAESGAFDALGVLSDSAGNELTSDAVAVSGEAGEMPLLEFHYPCELLMQREGDGPFVLSTLRLVDRDLMLPCEVLTDAYTTASYANLSLSGWEARLGGETTDLGVDLGGDEAFELLRVRVPIEVRRVGAYTVTLDLETRTNARVGVPPATFDATGPGTYEVVFNYPGDLIAVNGDDGPYGLRSLVVAGPTGLALNKSAIGETSAYAFTQFAADTTPPESAVISVELAGGLSDGLVVTWEGNDPVDGSGLVGYDIQYRVGEDGAWHDWIVGTTLTSYVFGPYEPVVVRPREIYAFRSRARDLAGWVEDWPEVADMWIEVDGGAIVLPMIMRR